MTVIVVVVVFIIVVVGRRTVKKKTEEEMNGDKQCQVSNSSPVDNLYGLLMISMGVRSRSIGG